MTTEHGPEAANEPTTESVFHWKRKRYFDGTTCGLKDCSRPADGYIADVRPTKGPKQLWYGPACAKCVAKSHQTLKPISLAELAHQRHGVSDLALVLDIETGEAQKRLSAAGLDERGRPLNPEPTVTPGHDAESFVAHAEGNETVRIEESIVIPRALLQSKQAEAEAFLARLDQFHITDQTTLDAAGELVKMVKRTWSEIDTARKDIARPLQNRIKSVQGAFTPVLDVLIKTEAVLKDKISEGLQRARQAQQAALQAAQQAHQQGNMGGAALAATAAQQADVNRPAGVVVKKITRWRIADPSLVPAALWSPDPVKIQAAIDAGYNVPGVEVWQEDSVQVYANR